MPRFKLVFFSPTNETSRILAHLFSKFPKDVGKIGDYESCAFTTRGTGQFKPGPEANPHIGSCGELECVEEDRVEVVVNDKGQNEEVKGAIRELKSVHPYEEVAYDVYRLEDF
ncbi:GTP cyclohydrolase 1 type 2/Nif3 [Cytidiella melzeri]|nr:GTP cyclohydrolase 1 type 2/Nif3 [Cytidiella melzeri]